MTLIAAFLGWMFDGMEMGIWPLIASSAMKEMAPAGLSEAARTTFINRWIGINVSTFLLGAAAGGLVFGWLGDRIGRVRALSLSILCYSIFTGLCYFAGEPWHLAGLRFVAALGMGGEWSLGVALVMEAWPGKFRPLMAGIIGAAANVGFVLMGLIGIMWPVTPASWRWVFLVGAIPALLTFFIRLFVPESQKWKHAVETAKSSGVKAVNPLREIFSPPLRSKMLFAMAFATIPLFVTWGTVQWIPIWTDFMAGPGRPEAKGYSHFVVAFAAIFGCLAAPLVGQKLGRRPAYFGMCLLALLSAIFLFTGTNTYGPLFITAVALLGFFASSFYGWLPLYLPELFPTRVRATAQGVAFNFGRIITAIGVWFMGSILGFFDGSYAMTGMAIASVYVIGMVLIWFAPETKGKPLPD